VNITSPNTENLSRLDELLMIWILNKKNVDGVANAHLEEAEGLHDVLHCVILLHIVTTMSLTFFQS
jgi:hypothetical protein